MLPAEVEMKQDEAALGKFTENMLRCGREREHSFISNAR